MELSCVASPEALAGRLGLVQNHWASRFERLILDFQPPRVVASGIGLDSE